MGIAALLAGAVGVFDRGLRLADASQSLDDLRLRQNRAAQGHRLAWFCWRELLHQLVEQLIAPGKMGIAGRGYRPERDCLRGNRAALPGTRGLLPRQPGRGGSWPTQQLREPALIQEHLLMCRTPESADLLFLASGGKGRGSYSQRDEAFEVVDFGITAAGLPLRLSAPGDMQQLSQLGLCQADMRPQGQHQLTESIVPFTIRGLVHVRSPLLVTQRSAIL